MTTTCFPIERTEPLNTAVNQQAIKVERDKSTERAMVKQLAWGFCAGMTGGFLGVVIVNLVEAHFLLALGFLGPVLASCVGTIGLFKK